MRNDRLNPNTKNIQGVPPKLLNMTSFPVKPEMLENHSMPPLVQFNVLYITSKFYLNWSKNKEVIGVSHFSGTPDIDNSQVYKVTHNKKRFEKLVKSHETTAVHLNISK